MHVMAPRENWTDERPDDLKDHMDEGFGEVRAEVRQLRSEVVKVREETAELRTETKGFEKRLDDKFEALNRTMQIGFSVIGGALAVIGAVLAGLIGLIATQL
jgi:predicted  nucleic acid-binding Zn-ribbon protein